MKFSNPVRPALDHPIIWLAVLGATLGSIMLLNKVAWLALPLILAIVFYYLVKPLLQYLQHLGISPNRALSLFLVMISLLTLIASVTLLPALFISLERLQTQIPEYLIKLESVVRSSLMGIEAKFSLARKAGLVAGLDAEMNQMASSKGVAFAAEGAVFLVHWLPGLLLVPFLTFFFLRDGTAFHRLILRAVPNAFFEKTLLLFDRMDDQMRAYFRGMLGLTLLDTVTLGLGLWFLGHGPGIFGFWDAMLLGLICAIFAWIPYVGSAAGGLVAVATCAVKAPQLDWMILAVVILFLGVRLLDELVYTPMTVGRALRMHPLITVMMIFSGGMLGGIYGLLLAMPLLGIFTVLGQIFGEIWFDPRLRARHQSRLLLEKKLAYKDLNM